MEKKIISKESLANLFAKNEIEAAELLRDALMEVKNLTGSITDPDIKYYNSLDDARFSFDISLTTIKNYSAKYGYGIFNVDDNSCVVKQFSVEDYKSIKKKLEDSNENKGDIVMETNNNLTAAEKLAVNYVKKSEEYNKKLDAISVRCASSVNERLKTTYSKYSMMSKQFIISYLLDIGLAQLEDSEQSEKK